MTAVTTLPQVNLASSGPMLPPAASQESAITSVATKTITETLRINEKDIKTSRWAIACGALAVTITALAISTLQPLVIASTLPMAAVLALLARGGFLVASEERKLAKQHNAELDVVQKIDEFLLENSDLIEKITSLDHHLTNKTQFEKAKYLIDLGNRLLSTLPDRVKSHFWVRPSISSLEPLHKGISEQLSNRTYACKAASDPQYFDSELCRQLYQYTPILKYVIRNLKRVRDTLVIRLNHSQAVCL